VGDLTREITDEAFVDDGAACCDQIGADLHHHAAQPVSRVLSPLQGAGRVAVAQR